MITVYRVQAEDGRGPWRPGWSHRWVEANAPAGRCMETLMDLMPLPALRALSQAMVYGCACRSLPSGRNERIIGIDKSYDCAYTVS